MIEIDLYLDDLKLKLVTSPVVVQYTVLKERATATDGYLRVQVTLLNGDFVELTEYFVRSGEEIVTVDYRYQWMDATRRQLRRRWDNTPHHPETPNFPHHLHLEDEAQVIAGESLNISQVLDILEDLIEEK